MEIRESILETIGRTPMVRLRRMGDPAGAEIVAKIEGFNPMGSVKERIALEIVERAEADGSLKPGMTLLESSSGNTGIGLAMVGAAKGYEVVVTMPSKASVERRVILAALGARVVLTPPGGNSDTAWDMADELARGEPSRYFRVAQYDSPHNAGAHYRHTAEEIWEQCGGRLDAFVATLGTTGTIVGAGRRLKELDPKIRIVAAEPQRGHTQMGLRNLEESRVPSIWDPSVADERIVVTDEEAYRAARDLTRREGIFGGISSGTAVHAARVTARRLGRGRVVALLPDRGEKYLSTSLFPRDGA
ncbi:MAG TPA: PLP-dependent cysteine synthase family protein [Verrucomicrobiae bacterium]|nr:PLP-dependent cysteine synthase family protein [Verrucomicrobiae bacterium]